jgi:hypothetical protein
LDVCISLIQNICSGHEFSVVLKLCEITVYYIYVFFPPPLSGSDDSLRQRKQKSTGEDLDVLLKYHHSMQEKIADDMLILARNLKEQSQLAGSIIKKDTEVCY